MMTVALRKVEVPQYEVHPFADIWPLMNGTEFENLCSDIQENSQRVPIVIYQGKILDGRNRWNACIHLGIAAKTETAQVQDDAEALALVVSLNGKRRELISPAARAMVAAKLCNLKWGSNQFVRNKEEGAVDPSSTLRAEASKMFGISIASIKRAKNVISYCDANTIEAVHQGTLSLRGALRRVNRNSGGTPPKLKATSGTPKSKSGINGVRIRIPDGETFVQFYKRISAEPGDIEKKVKAAKIAAPSYRNIEAIVLLAERTDLSTHDRMQCAAALNLLESTGQSRAAFRLVQPIANRVWAPKTRRNRPDPRIERFTNALVVIEQVTQCADDIALPHLDDALQNKAIITIRASIASLIRLRRRCVKNRE